MNTFQYKYGLILVVLVIVGFFTVVGLWRLQLRSNKQSLTPSTRTQKNIIDTPPSAKDNPFIKNDRFYSPQLKISVKKLANYHYEEGALTITITNQNKKIYIGKIGTNATNITDYLTSLEQLNHVRIVSKESVVVGNIPAIKAIIAHPNNNMNDTISYFFYPEEWTVISIDTENDEAIPVLDIIAQSLQPYESLLQQ